MAAEKPATRRLFLALWPPDPVRRQLAAAARRWTRSPLPDANLHLTLVFLGACNEQQQRCYSDALAEIRQDPFDLQLDYLDGWARGAIQWLGCSQLPAQLPALREDCHAALARCGFKPDNKPFVPHVTLSRKEKNLHPGMAVEGIRWHVADWVLAESEACAGGVRYTVLRRWPVRRPA